MNVPPQAPMPPVPPGFFGHGEPPYGAIPVEDIMPPYHQGHDPHDDHVPQIEVLQDGQQTNKANKKKKANTNNTNNDKKTDEKKIERVETHYVGFILERAEPLLGQNPTWTRAGRRSLPFDQQKLVTLVKQHRARSGTTQLDDFKRLHSHQQGIITRLIAEHQNNEKNPRAQWELVDVQCSGIKHRNYRGSSTEVLKVQIVIKRFDRDAAKPITKNSFPVNTYQSDEIIDLAMPMKKPLKETPAKPKKETNVNKLQDIDLDFIEEPMGNNGIQVVDVGNDRRQFQDHGHRDHPAQPPIPQHLPPHLLDPVGQAQYQQPLPPGAIPIPQHPGFHPDARPQMHPFDPNLDPRQFEQRFDNSNEPLRARIRVRSPARRSRSRSRSRHSDKEKRRFKRLEGKVDEVMEKLDNWHISSDSSEGAYDEDSVFSPPPSGGSFTPPSTPPRSEYGPLGSLNRPKSPGRRGEHRYREHKYQRGGRDEQYEIEPGRGNGRRVHDDRYVRDGPRLTRAITYDDYPMGRAAEPRYLPGARRQQRRMLTDHPEGYDDAAFDVRRDRRRSDADAIREDFEVRRREGPERREAPRYARRNTDTRERRAQYW